MTPRRDRDIATAQQLSTVVNDVNVDHPSTTIDTIKAPPTIAKFKFRVENRSEGGQNRSTATAFHGAGQEIVRQKSFLLDADDQNKRMQTFAMNGKMKAGGIQSRSIIYADRTVKRLEARYLIEMKVQGSQPDQQDRS